MPDNFTPDPLKVAIFHREHLKDDVKSILRISSAHNKQGPADINIAQISHLSNFSDIKLWFIFIYEHNKPEQIDIQL